MDRMEKYLAFREQVFQTFQTLKGNINITPEYFLSVMAEKQYDVLTLNEKLTLARNIGSKNDWELISNIYVKMGKIF